MTLGSSSTGGTLHLGVAFGIVLVRLQTVHLPQQCFEKQTKEFHAKMAHAVGEFADGV